MNYRLFQYPLPCPPDLTDLNAYLASHRVASVAQHLVTAPGGPMLVFLVQSLGSSPPQAGKGEPKVDYRTVLDAAQFTLYTRLRDERRKIGEAEGMPVYAIFTNAQLAEIARKRPQSPADLAAIEGIGQARVDKYGAQMLALVGIGT